MTEKYQFDRHIWDVEPRYFLLQRKFILPIYSLFTLASGLIKASVLLFYQRLCPRAVSLAFLWLLRITLLIVIAYTVGLTIVPIFICTPISAFWEQVVLVKIAGGHRYTCIDEGAYVVANGVASTLQNLIVAFLPTILCWNLKIPAKQKLALYAILAVSYITIPIGALRIYSNYRIFYQTYDVTWSNEVELYSLLELHIASICANAPALKVFFTTMFKSDDQFLPSFKAHPTQTPWGKHRHQHSTMSISSFWDKVSFWKETEHTRYKTETPSPSTDPYIDVIQMHARYNPLHDQAPSSTTTLSPEPEFVDIILSPVNPKHLSDIQTPTPNRPVSLPDGDVKIRRPQSALLPAAAQRTLLSRSRSSLPCSTLTGRRRRLNRRNKVGHYTWMPWEKKEVIEIINTVQKRKEDV